MTMIFNQMHETILNLPNVQEFLKQDHKFDVVIVEWLYPTFAAFGAKYKAPMIGITSLGTLTSLHVAIIYDNNIFRCSHPRFRHCRKPISSRLCSRSQFACG